MWHKISKRNIIVRKGSDWLRQFPRAIKFFSAKEEDFKQSPPVLANSFPKSGTHLLTQILEPFPLVNSYGTFLASIPAIPHKIRPRSKQIRSIRKIVPGELIRAHLIYAKEFAQALQEKNVVHFFIYRDPRDVAVSEAYFLTYMFRWHSLHRYFKAFSSDRERISFAITGSTDPAFPYPYPNIKERFQWYKGWINEKEVFTVRFEELMSEHRTEIVKNMVEYYCRHSSMEKNSKKLLRYAMSNIQPTRSHTFRKGKVGGWKKEFTETHKEQMKEIAGKLLIDLGYEEDLNW